jgi:hypothetical protein
MNCACRLYFNTFNLIFSFLYEIILSLELQTKYDLDRLTIEVYSSHTHTHTPSSTPWTGDQPVALAATYATGTTEKYPCSERNSNPRSEQEIGCRITSFTAHPPPSALWIYNYVYLVRNKDISVTRVKGYWADDIGIEFHFMGDEKMFVFPTRYRPTPML